METKKLVVIAKELQGIMKFEGADRPPLKGDEKELTKWIKDASDFIEEADIKGDVEEEVDPLSKETIEGLKELGFWKSELDQFVEDEEEDVKEAMVIETEETEEDEKEEEEEEFPEPKYTPAKKVEKKKEVEKEEVEKPVKAPIKVVGKEKLVEKKEKKPGIISTIVDCVENSGKNGISKEEILKVLVELFPDKNEGSMKNTINVQIPSRISKERFSIKKMENGNYKKA